MPRPRPREDHQEGVDSSLGYRRRPIPPPPPSSSQIGSWRMCSSATSISMRTWASASDVVGDPAVAAIAHVPARTEDPQVLGGGRSPILRGRGDVADAQLAGLEQREHDPQTRGLGEHTEGARPPRCTVSRHPRCAARRRSTRAGTSSPSGRPSLAAPLRPHPSVALTRSSSTAALSDAQADALR